MSATTADYQNHFHPREYLRQYYSAAALTDDEAAIFRFLNEKLAGNSFATSLEFGCGPTVHHAFGLLPFVGELHLAEYLEGNRNEVTRWIKADPDAHDWDPQLRGILEIEARGDDLATRIGQLRGRATKVLPCDLFRDPPLDESGTYDLVASFYTAECLAGRYRSGKPTWPGFSLS